uniref:Multifunctional fusion protein n=1 Tax=Schistosoma haematobium TaxID=6185 RepID=A0A095CB23_SCHHA
MNRDTATKDSVIGGFTVINEKTKSKVQNVGVLAGIKSFSKEQEDIINLTDESYSAKVDIVIATPGRLVDHLYNTPGFSMERLRILVIDEADRVIVEEKQNWYHTLEDVLYYYTSSISQNSWSNVSVRKRSRPIPTVGYHYDRSVDITLQKILVSATLTHDPEPLKQFNLHFPILFTSNRIHHNNNTLDTVLNDHENAETNSSEIKKQVKNDENRETSNVISQLKSSENHTTTGVGQFLIPESLEEFLVTAKPDIRVLFLVYLVRQKHKKRILCFANTVDCAKRLNMLLASFQGIKSKFLSSHLHPDKRQRILNLFSVGLCQILVCTDSMARGIDINDVECVVSYDVPPSIKIYIHRIGRTARAGKKGTAYSLLSTNQISDKKYPNDLSRQVNNNKIVSEESMQNIKKPKSFFIDPYELTSSQPNLKFSISQSEIQPKLHDTIKQFVNWFTYSKLEKKNTDHSDESKQLIIQNNLVDIEAPEWLAKPLTFKFNINQLGINQSISYLDLPIHLRYHQTFTT